MIFHYLLCQTWTFFIFVYFISILQKKIYKKRDIQTLDSVEGVKETPQGFFIGQDLGANIARRLDRTIIIWKGVLKTV